MELTKINKYNNTSFYKIVCNDESITDTFVGHTTNLGKRMNDMVAECTTKKCTSYNSPINQFIRANGNWDNFNVVLIETVSCDTLKEVLHLKKAQIISNNGNLNEVVPTRTPKQWATDNKEHVAEHSAEYYYKNKEAVAETQRKYRETVKEMRYCKHVCECGGSYTYCNRINHENTIKHKTFIKA